MSIRSLPSRAFRSKELGFTLMTFAPFVALAIIILFTSAGCESINLTDTQKTIADTRGAGDVARKELDTAKATAEQKKQEAVQKGDDAGVEKATGQIDAIDKALARLAAIDAKLKQAEGVIANAVKPDGSVDPAALGQGIGAVLPPPWNLVAILGTGLVTAVMTAAARQPKVTAAKKQADAAREESQRAIDDAISIIKGIDAAANDDPTFAAALARNKGTLLENYTDTAFERVEKVKTPSAKRKKG